MSVLSTLLVAVLLSVAGCANLMKPTPQQERAYKAIEDCKTRGGQQDFSYHVYPDGGIKFEGRGDGFSGVRHCLEQRYGYRF